MDTGEIVTHLCSLRKSRCVCVWLDSEDSDARAQGVGVRRNAQSYSQRKVVRRKMWLAVFTVRSLEENWDFPPSLRRYDSPDRSRGQARRFKLSHRQVPVLPVGWTKIPQPRYLPALEPEHPSRGYGHSRPEQGINEGQCEQHRKSGIRLPHRYGAQDTSPVDGFRNLHCAKLEY